MKTTSFKSFVAESSRFENRPLPMAENREPCFVDLYSLPGASSLHFALSRDDSDILRGEISVNGKERVTIQIGYDEESCPYIVSHDRKTVTLPLDTRFEPPPPIPLPASPESLDLAVVVDGTTRLQLTRLLLADPEVWKSHIAKLEGFLQPLTEGYPDHRLTVFAFGDQPMPTRDVKADELQPDYELHPKSAADRQLKLFPVEKVCELLEKLPSTSGGDFVDALAEALAAAGQLHWRPEARKLVLLVGDSPGHSTEYPVYAGGDICVRARDVDVEAMRLHRKGVEIVTIYHDPPPFRDLGIKDPKALRLVEDARQQYRRLASLPEMSFEATTFDSQKASRTALDRPELIARGSSYGQLVEVSPPVASDDPE